MTLKDLEWAEEQGLAVSTNGDNTEPESEQPWEPREDLPPGLPEVPSLPPEMIPAPLRTWLEGIAKRACAPLEMLVCPTIASLGALVGRKVGILPSRYDDYLVVPNIWGGIIARPGAMKTYDIEQGAVHLKRLAAVAHDRFEAEREEMEAHCDRIEAEIAGTKEEMKKASKRHGDLDDLEKHLADLKRELKDATVVERRYLTQDATIEKLGELLNENPDGILVLRDELAGWLRTLDKPGREGDREFYLEGWNGTGGYTFDRIQRGTVHIPAVCLSIFGGIQPGKLSKYIQDAMSESGGADGLLQRLQLIVWPDGLGAWQKADHWPDNDAKNRAFKVFEFIDTLKPTELGVKCEDGSIPAVRFTPEAQDIFDVWRDELENRLRSVELTSTPAFESHLSKYRSLMPSLALLFHLVDVAAEFPEPESEVATSGTSGTPTPGRLQTEFPLNVPSNPVRMAAAWCEFLEAHARKIYASELYPGIEAAHSLAAKIEQRSVVDGQPVREIYRHHWSGLTNSSDVEQAIGILVAIGWVRTENLDTRGRPSEILRLHPGLRGGHGD